MWFRSQHQSNCISVTVEENHMTWDSSSYFSHAKLFKKWISHNTLLFENFLYIYIFLSIYILFWSYSFILLFLTPLRLRSPSFIKFHVLLLLLLFCLLIHALQFVLLMYTRMSILPGRMVNSSRGSTLKKIHCPSYISHHRW